MLLDATLGFLLREFKQRIGEKIDSSRVTGARAFRRVRPSLEANALSTARRPGFHKFTHRIGANSV